MFANAKKAEPTTSASCCSQKATAQAEKRSAEHHDYSAAGHHHHVHGHGALAENEHAVEDPVCGMKVDPHTAKHRHQYEGHTYYFCSGGCLAKFVADPKRYLEKSSTPLANVPEGTIYTCPMHPQIRQVGPGSCPICGMALEPVVATAEAGPNPELVDMTRRFWIGLVLSLPVLRSAEHT